MSDEAKVEKVEKNELKECQEQALRLRADFDNSKKRMERDKLDAIKFANERLLAEILAVVDNFDWAMTSLSEGHDPVKVREGLQIAQGELHKILEQHGVEAVKSVGEDFDPRFHEAVGTAESADLEDGKILEEVQRGYVLNGRLLRPSRVRIVQNKT